MARRIHSRYNITGTLIAETPIHIGGLGGNADTDLALAINGKGQYYIPGTSLAGAFRSWMQAIDKQATENLWGNQEHKSDGGHASFIIVEDAVIQCQNMPMEIRDGVAIDRRHGTVVDKMKFDRAILPKGVKIPLKITLERKDKLSEKEWDEYQAQFIRLLNSLINSHISLGAAKTRGLGRVKLSQDYLEIQEQKLLDRQGMLDCLLRGGTTANWDLSSVDNSLLPSQLDIEIQWQPIDTVMVKAEAEGIAVDIIPLVSGNSGSLTFVLPGSSIKGALRSQAERIFRTVCDTTTPKDFPEQIELDLIKTLFGSPAKQKEKTQFGYLGNLSVDDCFARVPLSPDEWANVEAATKPKDLRNALNQAKLDHTQQAFHVAIDRWTSGAADGFLYSVLEPKGVSWESINLSLNLTRLNQANFKDEQQKDEQKYLASIALVLLTLRDLMASRIPLGFGTNRGMGYITVQNIKIRGSGELNQLQTLEKVDLTQSNLSELNSELLHTLNNNWQAYLAEVRSQKSEVRS